MDAFRSSTHRKGQKFGVRARGIERRASSVKWKEKVAGCTTRAVLFQAGHNSRWKSHGASFYCRQFKEPFIFYFFLPNLNNFRVNCRTRLLWSAPPVPLKNETYPTATTAAKPQDSWAPCSHLTNSMWKRRLRGVKIIVIRVEMFNQ